MHCSKLVFYRFNPVEVWCAGASVGQQGVTTIRGPLSCNQTLKQSAWQMLFSSAYRCRSQLAFHAAEQESCAPQALQLRHQYVYTTLHCASS